MGQPPIESKKTQGFVPQISRHCLTKESPVRKFLKLFIQIKEPCVREFERIQVRKFLGILQTALFI